MAYTYENDFYIFYLIFKTVETNILLEMIEITKDQKDNLLKCQ